MACQMERILEAARVLDRDDTDLGDATEAFEEFQDALKDFADTAFEAGMRRASWEKDWTGRHAHRHRTPPPAFEGWYEALVEEAS